jgi:diadenosine tetraphosphate (Ap4A) HIT family hydrolase
MSGKHNAHTSSAGTGKQTHTGRCVVAYRGHVNELFELPDAELALFTKDVARAAQAIRSAFGTTFEMMPANKKLLSGPEYTDTINAIRAALRS